ncbi:MAG: response regulator [Bacteroidia bacterium]|nr:response regulator [Bacteroidia bacterium]
MRILIADDSKEIASRLQRLLSDLPEVAVAVVATTIESSIAALQTMRPDLLILDLHFPEGSGLEILSAISAGKSETQVILFSAFAGMLDHAEYTRAPVLAILDKSIDLEPLIEHIEKLYQLKQRRIGSNG